MSLRQRDIGIHMAVGGDAAGVVRMVLDDAGVRGTDTAARRIWAIKPKRSSPGKPRVIRYTCFAKTMAFCHTQKISVAVDPTFRTHFLLQEPMAAAKD
jgi:hypothetical protein